MISLKEALAPVEDKLDAAVKKYANTREPADHEACERIIIDALAAAHLSALQSKFQDAMDALAQGDSEGFWSAYRALMQSARGTEL